MFPLTRDPRHIRRYLSGAFVEMNKTCRSAWAEPGAEPGARGWFRAKWFKERSPRLSRRKKRLDSAVVSEVSGQRGPICVGVAAGIGLCCTSCGPRRLQKEGKEAEDNKREAKHGAVSILCESSAQPQYHMHQLTHEGCFLRP